MKRYVNLADLHGLGRLAISAARGVTALVEEVHIGLAPGSVATGEPVPDHPGGITGLVYRAIYGGYALAELGLDALLGAGTLLLGETQSTPEREALLAVLNGVWGDHLASSGNPLAITMSLRSGGVPLALANAATMNDALPHAGSRVAVLVHGLCMSDLGWTRAGHDHGAALAGDLGYTPVYLHYNSGLHVSANGRQLAALLEMLVQNWPQPVEELVLIGHSMGGLVARSACHYGLVAHHAWLRYLRKCVFLGTPHHGSHVERVGNLTGELLNISRYTAPFRRLGTHRSAGITDLRYGNLIDEDWEGTDRFANGGDQRHSVALPDGVKCYAIAGITGCSPESLRDRVFGDGLVPLNSALGTHEDPARCLPIPESQQWIGCGMSHLDLLDRPEVYAQLKQWLAA